jgi:CNT family concentrative nucleoside transporter
LQDVLDNALGHILTASVISAPAAIMLALIMVPATSGLEAQQQQQKIEEEIELGSHYQSLMDAITKGTADGLKLMANVGAMLLVLIALVALLNSGLSLLPMPGGEALTLQGLFGYLFAPLTWLMGIPWEDAQLAGSLMGIKTALNELLGFLALGEVPAGILSEKSTIILTYGLCGFANFGSLGIMIGGLTGLCPERTADILRLAPRSIWSGLLATCMTGAMVSLIL